MWDFEADTSNSILIRLDGVTIAQIISDNDLTEEDYKNAEFIVNACNAAENRD